MDDTLGKVFVGFVLGIACAAALVTVFPSYHSQAKAAITECEKSLPRDQRCVAIAVPAVKR